MRADVPPFLNTPLRHGAYLRSGTLGFSIFFLGGGALFRDCCCWIFVDLITLKALL